MSQRKTPVPLSSSAMAHMTMEQLKAAAHLAMPSARAVWIREIWKRTPKDYRLTKEKKKHVMVNGPHGTTLVCLDTMDNEELFQLWAKS